MSIRPVIRSAALLLGALALATGCATRQPAPVVERTPLPPPKAEPPRPVPPAPVAKPVPTHTIKRGETLVGIALQYGLDYRELAAWNGIANPNVISVGQVLSLAAPTGAAAAPPAIVATPLAGNGPVIEARPLANTEKARSSRAASAFPIPTRRSRNWPRATPLRSRRLPPSRRRAPAAAPGPRPRRSRAPVVGNPVRGSRLDLARQGQGSRPVHRGDQGHRHLRQEGRDRRRRRPRARGLRRAGPARLRQARHHQAQRHVAFGYAHNDSIVVKEQQEVKRGQKIAEMGASDADQVKLHFEVRRQGKPVDPARVLPPQ